MKKNSFWAVFALLAVLTACGTSSQRQSDLDPSDVLQNQPGDSTFYGLACDGCTDTILIVLPSDGSDPDTFDILEAMRSRQVFGRPQIGDRLALFRNRLDTCVADIVIDIDQLKGQWCYQVTPRLRRWAGMSDSAQQVPPPSMPDSIRRKLFQPRELGIQLNGDGTARPIGSVPRAKSSDEASPVEFPPQKRYHEWRIVNGRLLLNETSLDSLGNTIVTGSDTARLVMLRRDTLVLRIDGVEQGYYRKRTEELNN